MKKSILFLGIFIQLFISCDKTTDDKDAQRQDSELRSLRNYFLANRTPDEIHSFFDSAPLEVKQNLWIDKMNYLLEQNFSKEIKENIKIIKDFIVNFEDDSKLRNLSDAAVYLAKVIPQEDFHLMFESLHDYNYSGKFIGEKMKSEDSIKELVQLKDSYKVGSPTSLFDRKCTCKWCLIERFIADVTTECNNTRRGCGLLWLQECDKTILL